MLVFFSDCVYSDTVKISFLLLLLFFVYYFMMACSGTALPITTCPCLTVIVYHWFNQYFVQFKIYTPEH
jgi:hypothetical protein